MVAQRRNNPIDHWVVEKHSTHLERSFTDDELKELNKLVRNAMFYKPVQDRLIHQRDKAVLYSYNFSQDIRNWILTRNVTSLQEFAQAIQEHQNITGWDIL